MKKIVALLICLSLPLQSFGSECSVPVKLLEQGSLSPCRGYLFSPEKELEVRIKLQEHSLLQSEIATLTKIVDRLKLKDEESNKILELEIRKTELWKTRAEDITSKYVGLQEGSHKKDMGLVLLGVAITVFAGWSMGQAAGK